MCISSNIYTERNYKINLYKKLRICPKCKKQMSFHIEGNFGGALGVFTCECGYRDSSIENYQYATEDEIISEEATTEIMW